MGYRTPYHTSLSARVIRTNSSRHSGTLINFLPNPSYFSWLHNLISLHPVTSFSLVTCNFVSNLHFHFYYIISKKIGKLFPHLKFMTFLVLNIRAPSPQSLFQTEIGWKSQKQGPKVTFVCWMFTVLSNTDKKQQ